MAVTAGEPFENLTEQALAAPLPTLDRLIAKAQVAAQKALPRGVSQSVTEAS
ncbi:MAG TPA: hypothetical protein VII73_08370 [Caulobacteraceae bacterium]